jgi:hypothetical protein
MRVKHGVASIGHHAGALPIGHAAQEISGDPNDVEVAHLESQFWPVDGKSARLPEAEHHLRGALFRTHRKIVARIHQRVAFGFEHKSRGSYFTLDDFGIDAMQRLRVARARSRRRNIIGDHIGTTGFEGGKHGPVHGVGVGGELTHILEVVVVLRNPRHIHWLGSPNLAKRLFDLRNVAVDWTGDDRIDAGSERFVEGWQICAIHMSGGADGLSQEPRHIASTRNEL